MRLNDELRLPDDVVMNRVLGDSEGWILARPGSRARSIAIDDATHALLECFQSPRNIVDAVLQLSAGRRLDPVSTLDAAFDALRLLVADGFLVAATTPSLEAGPRWSVGQTVGGVRLERPVHLLLDTEIHLGVTAGGRRVAIKLAGRRASTPAIAALTTEVEALSFLGGVGGAPELISAGSDDGLPYLSMTWFDGVDLDTAAQDLRSLPDQSGRQGLLSLVRSVIAAYCEVHEMGILHGDVHPRNVLVEANGTVHLVDFGLAVLPGRGTRAVGGIDYFLAPEIVEELAAGRPALPTSVSEQYALGALCYLLLTGRHLRSYSLSQEEMWEQIREANPDSFAVHGVFGLTEVEAWLRRAVARDPSDRHRDTSSMLADFDRASAAAEPFSPPPFEEHAISNLVALAHSAPDGLPAPSATVAYGAAGVAYALFRVARARQDAALLADADVWSTTAVARLAVPSARWATRLGITPKAFGHSSLLHNAAGVHAVQACVAAGRGDSELVRRMRVSIGRDSSRISREDLVFGRAGVLCAVAMVIDETSGDERLRAIGDTLACEVADRLDDAWREEVVFLGMAHGIAGRLYSLLRWHESTGWPLPRELDAHLSRLAGYAEHRGRGAIWPRTLPDDHDSGPLIASWCNGSAGHAILWALVAETAEGAWASELAIAAAWSAVDLARDASGDLCCGWVGRAYAMLAAHRITQDETWVGRAKSMRDASIRTPVPGPHPAHSLLHGRISAAVLTADLEAGVHGFPLFGSPSGLVLR